MPTLAESIATAIRTLVASGTIVDLTNQRNAAATTEQTAVTEQAAEFAAAEVQESLGEVDGSDAMAVRCGVGLALMDLNSSYAMILTPQGSSVAASARDMLETVRKRRVAGAATPQLAPADYSDLRARYPSAAWDDVE